MANAYMQRYCYLSIVAPHLHIVTLNNFLKTGGEGGVKQIQGGFCLVLKVPTSQSDYNRYIFCYFSLEIDFFSFRFL